MKLSVAVITYNEEANMTRFLEAVSDIAEEIIVVDSCSTDKTKEIATSYHKVKFVEHTFRGFGEQKNLALENCKNDWILFLDADEIPDDTLKKSIVNIVKGNSEFDVYTIKFINHLGERLIKYGGWSNILRERFFKKSAAKYSDDIVHEYLIYDGVAGKIEGYINHYTYKSMAHHVEKINLYSTLMAEKNFANGMRVKKSKYIFSPFFAFTKTYFFRLGFLDGAVGFYVAITTAYYTFLKYIKMREIAFHHKKRNQQ